MNTHTQTFQEIQTVASSSDLTGVVCLNYYSFIIISVMQFWFGYIFMSLLCSLP